MQNSYPEMSVPEVVTYCLICASSALESCCLSLSSCVHALPCLDMNLECHAGVSFDASTCRFSQSQMHSELTAGCSQSMSRDIVHSFGRSAGMTGRTMGPWRCMEVHLFREFDSRSLARSSSPDFGSKCPASCSTARATPLMAA